MGTVSTPASTTLLYCLYSSVFALLAETLEALPFVAAQPETEIACEQIINTIPKIDYSESAHAHFVPSPFGPANNRPLSHRLIL